MAQVSWVGGFGVGAHSNLGEAGRWHPPAPTRALAPPREHAHSVCMPAPRPPTHPRRPHPPKTANTPHLAARRLHRLERALAVLAA